MSKTRKRRCRHCGKYFVPDCRNVKRQRYCRRTECRKASKRESQRRWLEKPENRNYFRGPENIERVREWRRANPGYWLRAKDALQDCSRQNAKEIQPDKTGFVSPASDALQDSLFTQPPVLIGLIAQFAGSALQDDMEKVFRTMEQSGLDILNGLITDKGGQNGEKASHPP